MNSRLSRRPQLSTRHAIAVVLFSIAFISVGIVVHSTNSAPQGFSENKGALSAREIQGIYSAGKSDNYTVSAVWPMSGHDAQRRGRSPFAISDSVPTAPNWTKQTAAPVVGDIVVSSEGIIYFASDKLYALNPDGTNFVPPISLPAIPSGSPAIDDVNGYVYFAFLLSTANVNNNFEIIRYNKQLQNPQVIHSGVANLYGGIAPLIIGPDNTLFVLSGRYPAKLTARGTVNWTTDVCSEPSGTPAVGDSGIFMICWGDSIKKVDFQTGQILQTAGSVDRNQVEPMIDGLGNILSGHQAFNGVTYYGAYTKWNSNLSVVNNIGGYTTSRASLMPDGTSTVRLGYGDTQNALTLNGATNWEVYSAVNGHFTTPPAVDSNGKIIVGKVNSLLSASPVNGSTIWEVPTSGRVTTQPVISRDGAIYVGTNTGAIHAFLGNGNSCVPEPPGSSYDDTLLVPREGPNGPTGVGTNGVPLGGRIRSF